MNDVVRYENRLPESAASIRGHVNLIQEVMQAVMKEGTHYGKIPGTPKPSLWKPGAEVLAATFHIAPSYRVEDLSGADFVRYRVSCTGTHQASGTVMGEGMGECSSLEEKYKWRKSSSNREFDNTPEERKRIKYGYDRDARKEYEIKQVRAESADQANTILKMACKRAQVAMTLNVVAASDIFTQDIEDLPPELRPDEETQAPEVKKPEAKKQEQKPSPQPKSEAHPLGDPAAKLSDGQKRILKARMESAKVTDEAFKEKFGCSIDDLAASRFNEASAGIRAMAEAVTQ